MTTTKIDAVAMVRAIRDAHYELLKNKTHAERIAFYRAKAEHLHAQMSFASKSAEPPSKKPSHTAD